MSEPKKPLWQRALDKAMGFRAHPDEGKIALDAPVVIRNRDVTMEQAQAEIRREEDALLESQLPANQFGGRTFPSAFNVGPGRTPSPTSPTQAIARQREAVVTRTLPFFTDPGSGKIDMGQYPHDYVQATPSSARTENRERDAAKYPAPIPSRLFDPDAQPLLRKVLEMYQAALIKKQSQ